MDGQRHAAWNNTAGSYQPVASPGWISAAIQNGIYPRDTLLDAIVDSERKTLGEKAVVAEMPGVNASTELQRIDVGE